MGFPLLHYSITKVMSRACLCGILHDGSLPDRFPFGRGAFTCAQVREQVERSPVGLLRVRPRRRGRGLGRTTETGGQGQATGRTPLGSGLEARILVRVDWAGPPKGWVLRMGCGQPDRARAIYGGFAAGGWSIGHHPFRRPSGGACGTSGGPSGGDPRSTRGGSAHVGLPQLGTNHPGRSQAESPRTTRSGIPRAGSHPAAWFSASVPPSPGCRTMRLPDLSGGVVGQWWVVGAENPLFHATKRILGGG